MTASSHIVSFAGRSVSIECADPESNQIVERLYGHLTGDRSIAPAASFRLGRAAPGGAFVLFCGDTLEYHGPCVGMVAAMLLDRTVRHLAAGNRAGVLLHAGCVARDGKAVILPGKSGAGKTTLTAWLARHGFDYLSDELVFVPEGSTRLEAFHRPLNVKDRGRPPLEALYAFGDGQRIIRTPEGFLVSPTLLRQASRRTAAHLIVFPSYRRGARLAMRRLSSGRTAFKLLACLVNSRQLHDHGLAQTTQLARTLPAYSITWGNLGHADESLERLFNSELAAPRKHRHRR